ncbi:MAG: GGDEF domain-containing protein [Deltaproteobacteria bacterium]|nr:GGDEF domain-containing protein [Deltaproteobacteria bacterium]
MRNVSIRTKLILTLSSVLVLAFVCTSLLSYFVSRGSFRSNIIDETLPLISNNIYSEIQRDLMRPIYVSSLMANDTFLKDWALGGEKDMEKITKYLKEIKDKYGFSSSFFVSEATGNYYYYAGILKKMGPQDAHDVWYYDFIESGAGFGLDVDTDEAAAGTLTVFINHRLEGDGGLLLGVTGVALNMEKVGAILRSYREKYKRTVYMVDSEGLVQMHPDNHLVERARLSEMEGIEGLEKEILTKKFESHIYEFDRNGRRLFLALRYFPDFDWFLIVEQGEGAPLRNIRVTMFGNLGVGFLVTCFIIAVVIFTVNRFQGRLEALATVDDLTKTFNRRHFMDSFKGEAARAARYGHPVSLLMIDADRFKSINDTFGHHIGDEALRNLASIIKDCLREVDVLGRLGGEEFAVLLPETGKQAAVHVAQRIRAAVESGIIETEAGRLRLTVSVGVASAAPDSIDTKDLLKQADAAMYRAKEEGRNRVCVETEKTGNEPLS